MYDSCLTKGLFKREKKQNKNKTKKNVGSSLVQMVRKLANFPKILYFMYRKTKFSFKFQNFLSNTNISHKTHYNTQGFESFLEIPEEL